MKGCSLCGVTSFFSESDKKMHNATNQHCQKYLITQATLGFSVFNLRYRDIKFEKATPPGAKGDFPSELKRHMFRAGQVLNFVCKLCGMKNNGGMGETSWLPHVEGTKHALNYAEYIERHTDEEFIRTFGCLPKPSSAMLLVAKQKVERRQQASSAANPLFPIAGQGPKPGLLGNAPPVQEEKYDPFDVNQYPPPREDPYARQDPRPRREDPYVRPDDPYQRRDDHYPRPDERYPRRDDPYPRHDDPYRRGDPYARDRYPPRDDPYRGPAYYAPQPVPPPQQAAAPAAAAAPGTPDNSTKEFLSNIFSAILTEKKQEPRGEDAAALKLQQEQLRRQAQLEEQLREQKAREDEMQKKLAEQQEQLQKQQEMMAKQYEQQQLIMQKHMMEQQQQQQRLQASAAQAQEMKKMNEDLDNTRRMYEKSMSLVDDQQKKLQQLLLLKEETERRAKDNRDRHYDERDTRREGRGDDYHDGHDRRGYRAYEEPMEEEEGMTPVEQEDRRRGSRRSHEDPPGDNMPVSEWLKKARQYSEDHRHGRHGMEGDWEEDRPRGGGSRNGSRRVEMNDDINMTISTHGQRGGDRHGQAWSEERPERSGRSPPRKRQSVPMHEEPEIWAGNQQKGPRPKKQMNEPPMRPGYAGPDGYGDEVRGNGMQRPANKGPGNAAPGMKGPGNRDQGNVGPGNRGPGNRGPGNMGPGNRGPGNMGPGNRGPGNMGPGNREPGSVGPGAPAGEDQPGQKAAMTMAMQTLNQTVETYVKEISKRKGQANMDPNTMAVLQQAMEEISKAQELAKAPAGAQAGGPQAMATPTMGQQAAGPQAMGPQGMGPQAMGPQGMGPQAMGPQGMAQQAMGPQGMGLLGAGPQGPGPQRMGPQGMRPQGPGPQGRPNVKARLGPKPPAKPPVADRLGKPGQPRPGRGAARQPDPLRQIEGTLQRLSNVNPELLNNIIQNEPMLRGMDLQEIMKSVSSLRK